MKKEVKMVEEKIEVIEDEEDPLPENYTEEELTDKEKKQAKYNVDSLVSNLRTAEHDLSEMKYQLDIRLPQRQAGIDMEDNIDKKQIELDRFKEQFKMYKRRVRTGKKRIPVVEAPETE